MYERIYCREQTDHMISSMPDTRLVCIDMHADIKFSIVDQNNWFSLARGPITILDFLREECPRKYLVVAPSEKLGA